MTDPNLKKRGLPYNRNPLIRGFCITILRLFGWRVVGEAPPYDKYVLLGAPHTTNWDFALFVLVAGYLGLRPSFTAKDSLFKPPLIGAILRRMGGVAIDRSQPNGLVQQAIQAFATHDQFILLVTPEGTRKWSPRWKTGFYRIAMGAEVPIVMAFVDYPKKVSGIGPALTPTGDMDTDLLEIQKFYADKRGKFPNEAGPVLEDKASDSTPQQ